MESIRKFLSRHRWRPCEDKEIGGWILPGKYWVKNMQEAFQCQQTIFRRKMILEKPRTAIDQFFDGLSSI